MIERDGRRVSKRWGDTDAIVSTGLTRTEYEQCRKEEIDRINQYSPWKQISQTTRVRDAPSALALLAMDHFDSIRVVGTSNMCHSMIDNNDKLIADSRDAMQWDIVEGEPFMEIQKDCRSGYKGDDADMQNWPTEADSISLCGVWGFFWRAGLLAHSRYSNIVTLISGEGCHSPIVKKEAMKQMTDLCNLKKLVFWSNMAQCWICMYHRTKCCFDWPFECSVTGLLNHGGIHPFHGLKEIDNGVPLAIPFNYKLMKHIFKCDIDPRNYNINFREWQTSKKSGYVLTTPEIHWYEQQIAKTQWLKCIRDARAKNDLEKFNDIHKCQEMKRAICAQESICVVDVSRYKWRYNLCTDFFHCFNSYMLYHIKTLGMRMHCLCHYDRSESIACIQEMRLPFVTKSYKKYIDNNRGGKIEKDWCFNSNGHGYKLICEFINESWCEAAWIEHDIIEDSLDDYSLEEINTNANVNIDISLFIPTLKYAACYVAHKYLRRAWGGIWSSTTSTSQDGELSNEVKEIKHNWRKGFNILMTFVEETVCIYYLYMQVKPNINNRSFTCNIA